MADASIAPEYELFPDRYRWTVRECREMAASGRLVGRYEILDGEVISKTGQNPAHAAAIKRVMRALAALFGLDLLWIQSPITLAAPDSLYTEPEPDIAVTRASETSFVDRHPGPEDLMLVVEVSDTTARTDLIVKGRVYARAGIPEYWVIDLAAGAVHVHRAPVNGAYTAVTTHGALDMVAALTHPDRPIAVSELVPPDLPDR